MIKHEFLMLWWKWDHYPRSESDRKMSSPKTTGGVKPSKLLLPSSKSSLHPSSTSERQSTECSSVSKSGRRDTKSGCSPILGAMQDKKSRKSSSASLPSSREPSLLAGSMPPSRESSVVRSIEPGRSAKDERTDRRCIGGAPGSQVDYYPNSRP